MNFQMKLTFKISVLFLSLFIIGSKCLANSNATENVSNWYGNGSFNFAAADNQILVSVDKNPWESFTVVVKANEIVDNPFLYLSVKSTENVAIRIDLSDGTNFVSDAKSGVQNVSASLEYGRIVFDLRDLISRVNLVDNVYLIVYLNPGKKFQGSVAFSDVSFKAAAPVQPQPEQPRLNLYPTVTNSFTNVEIPEDHCKVLKVYDANGHVKAVYPINQQKGSILKVQLENLAQGNYFIRIDGNSKAFSNQLIVN